jgi:hypothetical protein
MPKVNPAPEPTEIPIGILSKATPSEIPSPVPTDKPQLNMSIGMFLFLVLFVHESEFESI